MNALLAKACAAALLCAAFVARVDAKLPPPTPEQQQAAAAKKAQAAEQAEKEKQALSATMDKIAERWRAKAAANGWKTHGVTAVAAPESKADTKAETKPTAQPPGRVGEGKATLPVRSEKSGTAPPSADVKQPAKQAPPDQIK